MSVSGCAGVVGGCRGGGESRGGGGLDLRERGAGMGVVIRGGVDAEAGLHGVDEDLEAFDAVAEAFEGFGHGGEEFAGVGLS